jgi:hypothetical protein
MVFGAWNAYYVRQVGNPVIERDDSFAFNLDMATFRAKWRVDGDLIDTSGALNLMKQSVYRSRVEWPVRCCLGVASSSMRAPRGAPPPAESRQIWRD